MSSYLDYVDRKVDLLAYDGIATTGSAPILVQQLASESEGGKIVTGVQKLIQRFVYLLLTIRGSVAYNPLVGCDFLIDIQNGQIRGEADVRAAFSSAEADIAAQLLAMEVDEDPDDERYDSADLTYALISGDNLIMQITLTTVSGDATQFIQPLPITL